MKLQFRDGTGSYVRGIEAVEFLGTGVRIIVFRFNVISDEASRNTQAVLAFEILHTRSQSLPAALNKGVVMLSSRIQRKCKNRVRYIIKITTGLSLSTFKTSPPVSPCILSSKQARVKFREISVPQRTLSREEPS